MKTTVSPKQAARALEVSESSVKRWCDRGDIPMQTTPGGHRRIPIQGLLEFCEGAGRALSRPDLLGIRAASRPGPRATRRLGELFRDALLASNEARVQAVLLDAHLSGHSASIIGDEIVAPTFSAIGDLWECGEADVFQERHACELAGRAVQQVRQLLAPNPVLAPLALGGAVSGDYYGLATLLVELVLREQGWNAASLGCNLPIESMEAAFRQRRPRLFWLSVSHLSDEAGFVRDLNQMAERFPNTTFALGGRMATEAIRGQLKRTMVFDSLRQFERFVVERFESTVGS